jgi:hypothetical protein
LAWANLFANIGIVVTGGAVRLTGSGLGCPEWPRCTEESWVATPEMGLHGAVEFGNRLLTFVLIAIAVGCWLAVLQRNRSAGSGADRPAFVLATLIALGIPLQALIGGITVWTDLNPWIVALHLLISMAMIALCVWLLDRVVAGRRIAAGPRPREQAVGGVGVGVARDEGEDVRMLARRGGIDRGDRSVRLGRADELPPRAQMLEDLSGQVHGHLCSRRAPPGGRRAHARRRGGPVRGAACYHRTENC